MSKEQREPVVVDNTQYSYLDDVLVLTVQKGFWAATECEIFPHRINAKYIFRSPGKWGGSRNPINVLNVAVGGYIYCLTHKPKVILFGAAPRVSAWFARLKQVGVLPNVKMIAAGAMYMNDDLAQYFDKLYIFSRNEVLIHKPELQDKFAFIPLPGPVDFISKNETDNVPYIFSGGGRTRDFAALIEAVKGLDIQLKIATFSPNSLGYKSELPNNCTVYYNLSRDEFLEMMAQSLFVAVPLVEGLNPHGHTTIVEALYLTKAIITTSNASIDDYITKDQEGIMVSPGDITGYRQAINKMLQDTSFRQKCENNAKIKSNELTYLEHSKKLAQLCYQVMES